MKSRFLFLLKVMLTLWLALGIQKPLWWSIHPEAWSSMHFADWMGMIGRNLHFDLWFVLLLTLIPTGLCIGVTRRSFAFCVGVLKLYFVTLTLGLSAIFAYSGWGEVPLVGCVVLFFLYAALLLMALMEYAGAQFLRVTMGSQSDRKAVVLLLTLSVLWCASLPSGRHDLQIEEPPSPASYHLWINPYHALFFHTVSVDETSICPAVLRPRG